MSEALSGLTGSLQGQVQGLVKQGQSLVDRILPPETRNKIVAWISKFAAEKPMLASFIASHIALSGIPLGLFIVMTFSVGVFALITALILALLLTLGFIVLCAGFALIFLLPTLFVTTAIATFLWLWGVGTYYIIKHFNQHDIPGLHVPLKEGMQNEADEYAQKGVEQGYHENGLLGNASASRGEARGREQREEAESTALDRAKQNNPGATAQRTASGMAGQVTGGLPVRPPKS